MKKLPLALIIASLLLSYTAAAETGRVCVASKGRIFVRSRCLKKETTLSTNKMGLYGLSASLFGTSNVNATVSSDILLTPFLASLPSDPDLPDFNNLTVNQGARLTVPSGTVIRCKGTAVINGTINVTAGAIGSFIYVDKHNLTISNVSHSSSMVPAGQGIARSGPAMGQFGYYLSKQFGGGYSFGLILDPDEDFYQPSKMARFVFTSGLYGGAGGAGNFDTSGGDGGGKIVILAEGGITIGAQGIISANGYDNQVNGGGGGGGGVVILASQGSIVNHGSLQAKGGNGQGAGWSPMIDHLYYGPGGGGGGGFVNLISPSSITLGATVVSGGTAGASAPAVSFMGDYTMGGAAGGASYGNGGTGGAVNADGTVDAASAGQDGAALTTAVDPVEMF